MTRRLRDGGDGVAVDRDAARRCQEGHHVGDLFGFDDPSDQRTAVEPLLGLGL